MFRPRQHKPAGKTLVALCKDILVMNTTKQQTLLLLAIVGTLVLQVLLSAALLIRVNSVAQDVVMLQQILAGPPGLQSQETIIRDVSAEGAPSKGEPDAKVTIIVFSDFGCTACAEAWAVLGNILDMYPTQVRLVHRDFPLDDDPGSLSMQVANAAKCAGEQGHYWEMHDLLLANQDSLTVGELLAYGAQIGLEGEAFTECLETLRYAEDIKSDQEIGIAAGVEAVPTVFINRWLLQGARPLVSYKQIIEEELRK